LLAVQTYYKINHGPLLDDCTFFVRSNITLISQSQITNDNFAKGEAERN